jgi:hypothetical protein
LKIKRRKKSNEDEIVINFDFQKLFEIKQILTKKTRTKSKQIEGKGLI